MRNAACVAASALMPSRSIRIQLADFGVLPIESSSSKELMMKYRKLGRTGFDVSDIAYGLWGMSGWSGSDDKESLASLQLSVDLGCNFFDTAWAYGGGKRGGTAGGGFLEEKGKRGFTGPR